MFMKRSIRHMRLCSDVWTSESAPRESTAYTLRRKGTRRRFIGGAGPDSTESDAPDTMGVLTRASKRLTAYHTRSDRIEGVYDDRGPRSHVWSAIQRRRAPPEEEAP
jgi:hypothetical protein